MSDRAELQLFGLGETRVQHWWAKLAMDRWLPVRIIMWDGLGSNAVWMVSR